tara:strand:- start:11070 stop:11453 length:384 start_codon:yes stop_codon:yes gene_type:complete
MKKSKSSNKSFGIVFSLFFGILSIYKFMKYEHIDLYLISISLIFLILAFLYSKIFTPFNIIWIKLGDLLGKVVSPIIMFVIYFSVIIATSILLKIFRKDILNLYIDRNQKTFWRSRDKKVGDMTRQF